MILHVISKSSFKFGVGALVHAMAKKMAKKMAKGSAKGQADIPKMTYMTDEEYEDWYQRERVDPKREADIKEVISSPLWSYPVHQYIGDIVQRNEFRIDYEPEHKRICFQWYSDMVSEVMVHLRDWERIAAAVLRILPSHDQRCSPPDELALVFKKDVTYILSTYNLEFFEYLLRSFAIGLKDNCIHFVQKQLLELEPDLMKHVEAFVSKQSNKLREEQQEAAYGIRKTCENKNLAGIKFTTPSSFILSEEIDPEEMPSAPRDPELWEKYFLQVCSERLALSLAKEKEQWNAYSSKKHEILRSSMKEKLRILKEQILENPGVAPGKPQLSANVEYMTKFREKINKLIS